LLDDAQRPFERAVVEHQLGVLFRVFSSGHLFFYRAPQAIVRPPKLFTRSIYHLFLRRLPGAGAPWM